MAQKIVLTFDVDWAPEEVIADTLSIMDDFQVKATLFATHDSEVLHSVNPDVYEIGLHPNLNSLVSGGTLGNYKDVINELHQIYPESLGIRCHSLLHSSPMLSHFKDIGLAYDSNLFLPYQMGLKPFKSSNGLMRIPYFWEDDVHFEFGKKFNLVEVEMDPILNVFDFHPIHVFLNTDVLETYFNAKEYYQQPDLLLTKRNYSKLGARDFLIQLLSYIKEKSLETCRMKDLI